MIEPHGGRLVNRMVDEKELEDFVKRLSGLKTYHINKGDSSVFHRIADGTLSPLEGPMSEEEFYGVLKNEFIVRNGKKLAWTIPIAFPLSEEERESIKPGDEVAVVDNGLLLGSILVEEIYPFDKKRFLESVYGTWRTDHPGAKMLLSDSREYLMGGKIMSLPLKAGRELSDRVFPPSEARKIFKKKGWQRIVAFQTRNPPNRSHEFIMIYALEKLTKEGFFTGIVLNPIIGETKPDDVPAPARMRCYERLIGGRLFGKDCSDAHLWRKQGCSPSERAMLMGLDMKMFYAGPKEAVMHAIYRQNMGFTDIIIGRGHAAALFDDGSPIWGDFDAQQKFRLLEGELKIKPFNVGYIAYFDELGTVAPVDEYAMKGWKPVFISGSEVRRILIRGERPDPRIMRPEIADILVDFYGGKAREAEEGVM